MGCGGGSGGGVWRDVASLRAGRGLTGSRVASSGGVEARSPVSSLQSPVLQRICGSRPGRCWARRRADRRVKRSQRLPHDPSDLRDRARTTASPVRSTVMPKPHIKRPEYGAALGLGTGDWRLETAPPIGEGSHGESRRFERGSGDRPADPLPEATRPRARPLPPAPRNSKLETRNRPATPRSPAAPGPGRSPPAWLRAPSSRPAARCRGAGAGPPRGRPGGRGRAGARSRGSAGWP